MRAAQLRAQAPTADRPACHLIANDCPSLGVLIVSHDAPRPVLSSMHDTSAFTWSQHIWGCLSCTVDTCKRLDVPRNISAHLPGGICI